MDALYLFRTDNDWNFNQQHMLLSDITNKNIITCVFEIVLTTTNWVVNQNLFKVGHDCNFYIGISLHWYTAHIPKLKPPVH